MLDLRQIMADSVIWDTRTDAPTGTAPTKGSQTDGRIRHGAGHSTAASINVPVIM